MSEAPPSHPTRATGASGIEPEYRQRLAAREAELGDRQRVETAVSYSRLAMVVLGLVLAWLAVQSRLLSLAWAALPFAVFLALLVVHERVLRRRERAARACAFYRAGLVRLTDSWAGRGDAGERYLRAQGLSGEEWEHPYAGDLDLFGEGSLFELLSTARTVAGADTLARWLLAAADPAEARARQAAVADLASRIDLREDLFTFGEEVHARVDAEGGGAALEAWAHAPASLDRIAWMRPILPLLAAVNVAAALGWAFFGWGPRLLLVLGLVETVGALVLRQRVAAAVRGIDRASRDLAVLAELLERVEEEPLEAPWLLERVEALRGGVVDGSPRGQVHGSPRGQVHGSPRRTIERLQRLVDLLDSRRNPVFAPFGLLLLWTTQLAFAIEAWRSRDGARVVRWMRLVGELEAAASLATFASERPQYPFPEIVDEGGPQLAGRELGHPLIPGAARVGNDIELGGSRRALVVSGSNMSGKSTYLRTCGINVVLAFAGAPICGASLRLSPLAVGASIRIVDSLMEGASKFYAEIRRLRQILDLTSGQRPVLFLLDEILHGTNSHDRRIGAEAVLRALLEREAIGLVTTHDLALAKIAEDPAVGLHNVHFEDRIEGGKVLFDYQLRDGVVRRSNALALMREVGLDV